MDIYSYFLSELDNNESIHRCSLSYSAHSITKESRDNFIKSSSTLVSSFFGPKRSDVFKPSFYNINASIPPSSIEEVPPWPTWPNKSGERAAVPPWPTWPTES